jgi:mitogen-activated protein kinase organizer 1
MWHSCIDPVTSVVPTQDESTYLVMTLDGHVRLMDAITGKLLNDFSGHIHTSYRCRACFGHGEASVVAGDENGSIWAWDLLDVSRYPYVCRWQVSELFLEQAKPLKPNPPPKVHHKVVTWTEHHPDAGELITASADGTVKVWRYPTSGS